MPFTILPLHRPTSTAVESAVAAAGAEMPLEFASPTDGEALVPIEYRPDRLTSGLTVSVDDEGDLARPIASVRSNDVRVHDTAPRDKDVATSGGDRALDPAPMVYDTTSGCEALDPAPTSGTASGRTEAGPYRLMTEPGSPYRAPKRRRQLTSHR